MLSLIPKNHVALMQSQQVKSIAASLFKHFELQAFMFTRHYNARHKTITSLATDVDLYRQSIDNVSSVKSNIVMPRLSDFIIFQESVPLIKNAELRAIYERQMQIQEEIVQGGTEISVMKVFPDYTDCFDFIARRDDIYAKTRFMTNFDLLDTFISYFYDKASLLIEEAEKQKIIYHQEPYAHLYQELSDYPLVDRSAFLNDHPIRVRYFVNKAGELNKFTKVEIETIDVLLLGYSSTYMAKLLHVSPRTIESRINNIKYKTQCYSKAELVQFLLRLKVPSL